MAVEAKSNGDLLHTLLSISGNMSGPALAPAATATTIAMSGESTPSITPASSVAPTEPSSPAPSVLTPAMSLSMSQFRDGVGDGVVGGGAGVGGGTGTGTGTGSFVAIGRDGEESTGLTPEFGPHASSPPAPATAIVEADDGLHGFNLTVGFESCNSNVDGAGHGGGGDGGGGDGGCISGFTISDETWGPPTSNRASLDDTAAVGATQTATPTPTPMPLPAPPSPATPVNANVNTNGNSNDSGDSANSRAASTERSPGTSPVVTPLMTVTATIAPAAGTTTGAGVGGEPTTPTLTSTSTVTASATTTAQSGASKLGNSKMSANATVKTSPAPPSPTMVRRNPLCDPFRQNDRKDDDDDNEDSGKSDTDTDESKYARGQGQSRNREGNGSNKVNGDSDAGKAERNKTRGIRRGATRSPEAVAFAICMGIFMVSIGLGLYAHAHREDPHREAAQAATVRVGDSHRLPSLFPPSRRSNVELAVAKVQRTLDGMYAAQHALYSKYSIPTELLNDGPSSESEGGMAPPKEPETSYDSLAFFLLESLPSADAIKYAQIIGGERLTAADFGSVTVSELEAVGIAAKHARTLIARGRAFAKVVDGLAAGAKASRSARS